MPLQPVLCEPFVPSAMLGWLLLVQIPALLQCELCCQRSARCRLWIQSHAEQACTRVFGSPSPNPSPQPSPLPVTPISCLVPVDSHSPAGQLRTPPALHVHAHVNRETVHAHMNRQLPSGPTHTICALATRRIAPFSLPAARLASWGAPVTRVSWCQCQHGCTTPHSPVQCGCRYSWVTSCCYKRALEPACGSWRHGKVESAMLRGEKRGMTP